ncbi:hypothetical protein FOZ62_022987, partial [Perkinsus olseni]
GLDTVQGDRCFLVPASIAATSGRRKESHLSQYELAERIWTDACGRSWTLQRKDLRAGERGYAITNLKVVKLLMCVTGQDVGKFAFSSNEFYMAFSVYEDHRVGITFKVDGKAAFADGLYPLLKTSGHTYEVDFRKTYVGVDHWYQAIDLLFPGKRFRKGDLAFLYYKTADSITVNFRDRGVLLTRVGFGINPGIYLYRSPDAPSLK